MTASCSFDRISNPNFLCEIGTEEIPAGYILPAVQAIEKMVKDRLAGERIDFSDVQVLATPRRFAIMASGMAASQREEEVELKGPAAKAAYDKDGNPTRALEGFLQGNAVAREDVYTRETEKGAYLFAKKKAKALPAVEVLPSIIDQIVGAIPFPKRMRWSDRTVTFPRPIAYFLVLFNGTQLPYRLDGITAGSTTRGHFVQSNTMVEIPGEGAYVDTLRKHGVIVDHRERREMIREALRAEADRLGGTVVEDGELLDTVTFLVERPWVVACEFEREFLKIPDIVLVTEMKEHQKYFAVRDRNGALMSSFLVVSNNPPTDNVRKGNERVIRARFTDGGFFFNEDRKKPLSAFVEPLKDVLFHKDLGSIYDKVLRMRHIAGAIAGRLKLDDALNKKIERAVELSKADLNTAMVYEFTSLQGKIGRIYAMMDGEDGEVADAIDDHYRPRFHGDELPSGMVGVVVSLAEKIDNIFGSFSVGNIPKGSADPYALRRQANAIVDMLIDRDINIELDALLAEAAGQYCDGSALVPKILEFISARAKTIFTDKGLRYDEIDACLSTGFYDFRELYRRAKSLSDFRRNEQFTQMLLSFKRMNNICSAFRKKEKDYSLSFNPALLAEEAEQKLFGFFDSRRAEIERFIGENRYMELFELLIQGKPVIDAFFDTVMVMADDRAVRDNRLALLEGILRPFKTLLDFSKISD